MRFLNMMPILALLDLACAIENLRFFGVYFTTAVSSASITRFESTIIIPPPTPDKDVSHDVQAFWPGLEDKDGRSVLQPVVTNQGGQAGDWYLLPFYCCHPAGGLAQQMRVYPEDTVKNVLSLDTLSGKWFMNWVVTPGPRGNDAKALPFGGGLIFDPSVDPNVTGPYQLALLTIELQELGTWNFGDIQWTNILIEADTTDKEWCLKGPSRLDPAQTFDYMYTPPVVSVVGNSTMCYIAHFIFHQPQLGTPENPFTVAKSSQRTRLQNKTLGMDTWIDSAFARRR